MSQDNYLFGKSVMLQKGEVVLKQEKFALRAYLILTNQRFLYIKKVGWLAKDYSVLYGVSLEDIMAVSPQKHGLVDKFEILEKSGKRMWFAKNKIHSLIPIINKAIQERRDELELKQRKNRIHILLDFTSLRDVMEKGGLILKNFNCPKCNGSLPIPDHGKVLVCEYCNTPVKPIDIFEKKIIT